MKSYCLFLSSQGLIFVVDSNDRERIGEATDELKKMVSVIYAWWCGIAGNTFLS